MLHFASHTGLSPSMVTFSKVFCSRFAYNVAVLQPRWRLATSTVWAVPRSLATTGGIIHLFSLPTGTKMFQFPPLASHIHVMRGLQPRGLSHSGIPGSEVICTSPGLFAAYHALHRLREPRHPPCALFYFLSAFLLTLFQCGRCILRLYVFFQSLIYSFRILLCQHVKYRFALDLLQAPPQ